MLVAASRGRKVLGKSAQGNERPLMLRRGLLNIVQALAVELEMHRARATSLPFAYSSHSPRCTLAGGVATGEAESCTSVG